LDPNVLQNIILLDELPHILPRDSNLDFSGIENIFVLNVYGINTLFQSIGLTLINLWCDCWNALKAEFGNSFEWTIRGIPLMIKEETGSVQW